MKKLWKKVGPLPPEINEGYLWDCTKCGNCISWPFRGTPNDVSYKCPECSNGADQEVQNEMNKELENYSIKSCKNCGNCLFGDGESHASCLLCNKYGECSGWVSKQTDNGTDENTVNSTSSWIYSITTEVKETEDDFIFSTIAEFLGRRNELSRFAVSKQIIIRALTCYEIEHKDEYNFLLECMRRRIENESKNTDNGR